MSRLITCSYSGVRGKDGVATPPPQKKKNCEQCLVSCHPPKTGDIPLPPRKIYIPPKFVNTPRITCNITTLLQ